MIFSGPLTGQSSKCAQQKAAAPKGAALLMFLPCVLKEKGILKNLGQGGRV